MTRVEQPRETKRWSYVEEEVMYISFKKLSPSNRTWPPMPYVDFQPWRSLWNYTAYLHETGLFSAVGHAIPSFSCLWFCIFFRHEKRGLHQVVLVEAYQATLDGEIYRDLAQPCGAFKEKLLQHIINLRLADDHLCRLIKETVNPYMSHPLVHLEGWDLSKGKDGI